MAGPAPEPDRQPWPRIAEPLFGTVPAGWSRDGFTAHLRHMIAVCREVRPDRAEYWQEWLDKLNTTEPY